MTFLTTIQHTIPEVGIGRFTPNIVSEIFAGLDLTEGTRKQYEREIGRFVEWVEMDGWSPDLLVRFKNHLRRELSLSTNSKSKYLTVARVFVNRLATVGVLPFEVVSPKGFRVSRSLRRQPLTKQNVSAILSEVGKDSFLNAVVHFLYFQGLRGNEVRSLRVEDIEIENGGFFVRGKGRDEDKEWIRLHPRTLKTLKDYLKKENLGSGFLFPSPHNPANPISQPTMWRRLKKVFKSIGVDTNPHSFRKSFVSGLIEGGMDLITVSRFSRHRSIQQLQTYFDRVSIERSFPQFVESLEVSQTG